MDEEARKRSGRYILEERATYDVENVECRQRIFGARKAAAHLRPRSSLSSSGALQPRSTRVAGDSQRETLPELSSSSFSTRRGTTVLRLRLFTKSLRFTVSAPQRDPRDDRQFATARTSAMATIDALDRPATITRETQTSVSTRGMLCGSRRIQIDTPTSVNSRFAFRKTWK